MVQDKCECPYIDRTGKSITLSSYAVLGAIEMHLSTSVCHLALYIFSHNKYNIPYLRKIHNVGDCDRLMSGM